MKYFLIEYNRRTGKGAIRRTFGPSHRADAIRERFTLEAQTADSDVEVVVLGSRDEDTLLATHARYFSSAQELAAR